METLATQAVSLSVIIGFNLLVFLLVCSECSDHKVRFLKFVCLCQGSTLAWHASSAGLVYFGESSLLQGFSLATFFLSVFFMLAAVTCTRFNDDKAVYRLAGAIALIQFPLPFLSLSLQNIAWVLDGALMVATPVVTLLFFKQIASRLIAFLQAVTVVMFLSSAAFFNIDYPVVGGLLYLLVALFQPIVSVIFLISSIRLDRRNVSLRERDYRVFFESVDEVFFRMNLAGIIEEMSPSVQQFGMTTTQIVGTKLSHYLSDSNDFFKLLNSLISGRKPITYKGYFKTDSHFVDCEVLCSKIEDAETGRIYFAGSIRNTQERNMLERQFIEAQRHESLGLLAGGMAHDFNNLLQGVISYAELMQEAKHLDHDMKTRGFNAILKAATTAGELCKQLHQYTGKGIKAKDNFNLAEEIENVLEIIRSSCPDDVSISVTFPEKAAYIQGDRSQVEQIVVNLVNNAIDAVGGKGEIHILLSSCYLDEKGIRQEGMPASMEPGHYHQLEVSDNGHGIAAPIQARIFDPFFTTREKGHGLGLSAVKGILNIHRGGIKLSSAAGQGAAFTLYLPALVARLDQATPVSHDYSAQGKVVLLVEDDNAVREVASMTLAQAGYKVLEATDGIEALRVMGLSRETVNIVVTDIKMPNMDGIELASKLSEQIPGLPIVLISGYADVSETLSRAQTFTFQFVAKPFRGNELVTAVAKAAEQVRLNNSNLIAVTGRELDSD